MKILDDKIQNSLDTFQENVDLARFYQQYDWADDQWSSGFKNILILEKTLISAAKAQNISTSNIMEVACWGGLPNRSRIRCQNGNIHLPLYDGNEISVTIKNDPILAVRLIKNQSSGIGPTYISKVLRFSAPSLFGAIDSRLVRVFGLGDSRVNKLHILDLTAYQSVSGRWAIGPDNWPNEYGTWLQILDYMTEKLNNQGIVCPHPQQFNDAGLRHSGIWLPADVEMALFSYASLAIYGRPAT